MGQCFTAVVGICFFVSDELVSCASFFCAQFISPLMGTKYIHSFICDIEHIMASKLSYEDTKDICFDKSI